MLINKFFLLFIIIIFSFSCSKEESRKSIISEKSLDMQVLEAYEEGMNSLDGGDVIFAAKKFNEAELLYPQSIWAPKSALMAAYSYYIQDYYGDSIAELERFIKIYSKNKNIDYAYYLLAICYYEQIVDEKKDTNAIIKAKEKFRFIINKFPNTEFALDAEFKLDLIKEVLASKEMYIARHYMKKQKWIPAINRFKNVVDDYDTTIYVEEALFRLVEIYYRIGLADESKKYAKLLGYNYQSSKWYKESYRIFNKNYESPIEKIQREKSNFIVRKFKSIFN